MNHQAVIMVVQTHVCQLAEVVVMELAIVHVVEHVVPPAPVAVPAIAVIASH